MYTYDKLEWLTIHTPLILDHTYGRQLTKRVAHMCDSHTNVMHEPFPSMCAVYYNKQNTIVPNALSAAATAVICV